MASIRAVLSRTLSWLLALSWLSSCRQPCLPSSHPALCDAPQSGGGDLAAVVKSLKEQHGVAYVYAWVSERQHCTCTAAKFSPSGRHPMGPCRGQAVACPPTPLLTHVLLQHAMMGFWGGVGLQDEEMQRYKARHGSGSARALCTFGRLRNMQLALPFLTCASR